MQAGRRAAVALAMMLALSACREREIPRAQQEAALRDQLAQMRAAIVKFKADTGRYPKTLQELVPKHLTTIPRDPFTGATDTWRLVTEDVVAPNGDFSTRAEATESYIIDVQSGAGRPYSDY